MLSCSVVSDSLQPHGQQPTRLLCAWNFPGKNTGVGCHFLLQCMKVKSESEVNEQVNVKMTNTLKTVVVSLISCIQLFVPVAHQAPLCMGFSR